VRLKQSYSLPDWEGIDTHSENASKLSCILDEDEPWEQYQNVVNKLIGEKDLQSALHLLPIPHSSRLRTYVHPMIDRFEFYRSIALKMMWFEGILFIRSSLKSTTLSVVI